MTTRVGDRNDLLAISPAALAAYAHTEGWAKTDAYGDHSDVYSGAGLPEIIVPRTKDLGDYHSVVAQLVRIFAGVAERNEVSVYNDVLTADRDTIRVRVDGRENTVSLADGSKLVAGTQDAILATAGSLGNPRPVYRPGANREAVDFLSQVRLGQTEPGSFVLTLLAPVIAPPIREPLFPDLGDVDPPVARQMTRRLCDALDATRQAAEKTISGDAEAFSAAISSGVSANLCEALAQMIEPFPALDVSVTWARTRPMPIARHQVRFSNGDTPILHEAARILRSREPKPDMQLLCSVQRLQRDDGDADGTVTLRTSINGRIQSVTAVLNQPDYHRAIEAHKEKDPVIVAGDLDRLGQRWRLLNPHVVAVITNDDVNGA